MRFTFNCTYCGQRMTITLGEIQTTLRTDRLADVKCSSCDSIVGIDVSMKRRRQGKRWKALVAKRKAEHAAKVEAAKVDNERIAKEMLAEPGCECAAILERQRERKEWRDPWTRPDGLIDSTAMTAGIPKPPHHHRQCPRAAKKGAA